MRKEKHIFLKLLFLLLALFSSTHILWALEKDTHEFLNKKIARNYSFLSIYLKEQLGFSRGIEETLVSGNQNKTVEEWTGLGGKAEDEPAYSRSLNHFHDPLKSWSSAGFKGTFKSSVIWAQDQGWFGSQFGGDWSWKKARNSFYRGLTGPTKTERDTNLADMFRAIGQVMHLVEDASVPAHVRNDAHVYLEPFEIKIGKFHYEAWVSKNHGNLNLNPLSFDKSILSLTPESAAPIPISNIIDTNRYAGSNLSVVYGGEIGISEFTNANFFSEDTIFKKYPHPKKENTTANLVEQYAKDGKIDNVWYVQGYTSERLAAYSYFNKWLLPDKWEYNLDGFVYEDYASQLIPRAVGYSAGLLNYFFRGDMNMVADDTTGSGYVIVNNTDEDMSGSFELYYDNKNDERVKIVPSWNLNIGKKSSGNNKSTNITFTTPADEKEPGKYMLVFRGKLGNEEDAVGGRSINIEKEFLFLVNILNRAAAFEIKIENGQYRLVSALDKTINIKRSDLASTLLTVQSHPNKKEHMVALPWYRFNSNGIMYTTYNPDIWAYGGLYEDLTWRDAWGNPLQVVRGFPNAYVPQDFKEGSPYIWNSGFTRGEWITKKNGYYYDYRHASYIHGRRPFKVTDEKLVARNINIRKNDAYTYYGDDYAGPFHIQYRDESGTWVRGVDLQDRGGDDYRSSQLLWTECGKLENDNSWFSGCGGGSHAAMNCSVKSGAPYTSNKPIPVKYLAVLGEDKTIRLTENIAQISYMSQGASGTITSNSRYNWVYVATQVSECVPAGSLFEVTAFNTTSKHNYLELVSESKTSHETRLMFGNDVIDEFKFHEDSFGGKFDYDDREVTTTFQITGSKTNPGRNETVQQTLSGPSATVSYPAGSYTGFAINYGSNSKGTTFLSIMDYDHHDGDNRYILIYRYNEHESTSGGVKLEGGILETGIVNGVICSSGWGGNLSMESFRKSLTRYVLVYKIDGAIQRVNLIPYSTSTVSNSSSTTGFDVNCKSIGTFTDSQTTTGQQITGVSLQVTDTNMVYTYIVERYDNGTWVFDKRIIGIINIADNALPIGHRQEIELDFSGVDFDPNRLAAIGVTR